MAQKTQFNCNACGAEGTIRMPDDDYDVEVCPCCGNTLDIDNDDDYDE